MELWNQVVGKRPDTTRLPSCWVVMRHEGVTQLHRCGVWGRGGTHTPGDTGGQEYACCGAKQAALHQPFAAARGWVAFHREHMPASSSPLLPRVGRPSWPHHLTQQLLVLVLLLLLHVCCLMRPERLAQHCSTAVQEASAYWT